MNKLSRLLNGQFPEGFKRNIPPMTKAEFSLASNVLADLNKNHYAPIIKSRNEITDKYKDELYKLYRPNEQKNTTSIVVNSQDIDNAFKSVGISQIKDYKDRISYILSSGSFLLSSTFCRVGYKVNSYNYVEFEMLHPLIAYIFNTYFTGDRIPMGGYDCKPALSMYFDIYLDNYINYKRNKKEIDLFCQNIYKIGNTLRIKDNGGDRNALC